MKEGDELAVLDARAAELSVRGAQAAAQAVSGKVGQAEAALAAAQRSATRAKELEQRGLASREDVAKAEAELASARAALAGARGEQQVAGQNIASAGFSKSLTKIVAPISGVVLRSPENVGAAVSPDMGPLFVIAEALDVMRVDASVSETDIALVRPGQTAEVFVSAFTGRTFSATVDRLGIEPKMEGGAVLYPVTLLVKNPDGVLLPGMSARVRMQVARAENVLSVHEAALRFLPEGAEAGTPRSRVWKRKGPAELEPVSVKSGVTDGSYTEVTPVNGAQLAEGDPGRGGLRASGQRGRPQRAARRKEVRVT